MDTNAKTRNINSREPKTKAQPLYLKVANYIISQQELNRDDVKRKFGISGSELNKLMRKVQNNEPQIYERLRPLLG